MPIIVLIVIILTGSLFALSGCGDTGGCGESTVLVSTNPASSSTVNIVESGKVVINIPVIEPKNVDFIPPIAAITVNGEEEDIIKVTTCVDNDFSAENSNDPVGKNQEDLGTDLSFVKKFCDDGLYEVSLMVTDEQNLTAKDSTCLLVGMDEMPLVEKIKLSTEASFRTKDLDVGEHTFKVVVKDPEGHCVSKHVTATVEP